MYIQFGIYLLGMLGIGWYSMSKTSDNAGYIVGGRSRAYEQALEKAREVATEEMVVRATAMKANAVIGVDIDYEVFGEGGMMMVSLSGTAVLLSGEIPQEKLPTTK